MVAGTRGQRAIAVSVVVACPGRRQGWGVGGCPVTWCLEVVGGVAEKDPTLSRGRCRILHPRPMRQFTAHNGDREAARRGNQARHCVKPQGAWCFAARRFECSRYAGADLRVAVEGGGGKEDGGFLETCRCNFSKRICEQEDRRADLDTGRPAQGGAWCERQPGCTRCAGQISKARRRARKQLFVMRCNIL